MPEQPTPRPSIIPAKRHPNTSALCHPDLTISANAFKECAPTVAWAAAHIFREFVKPRMAELSSRDGLRGSRKMCAAAQAGPERILTVVLLPGEVRKSLKEGRDIGDFLCAYLVPHVVLAPLNPAPRVLQVIAQLQS